MFSTWNPNALSSVKERMSVHDPDLPLLIHRLRTVSQESGNSEIKQLDAGFNSLKWPWHQLYFKPLPAVLFDGFRSRYAHMWNGRMPSNKDLVNSLRKDGRIKSEKVADAMEQIDRGLFVPPGEPSYMDHPVPIGYNATISAPHMHAICLELLKAHLQPGMHVLDVGAGTGYLTAIFALMVGDSGCSVGIEHIPELTAQAVTNVQKSTAARLLNTGCLSLLTGDGRDGFPAHAPYDAIHVGAAAPSIPPALTDQLKPGGRLVIPVGELFQELMVIDKDSKGELKKTVNLSVRYVPLTDRQSQLDK